MSEVEIRCNHKCEICIFEWRNAQYNPDCFLREFKDFIEKIGGKG